jgi:hypothetical protein
MAAMIWRKRRYERSGTDAPEPRSPEAEVTDDIRHVFRPDGEMGARLAQLLAELEALRIQVAERTFPENDVEVRRLEAASILISTACSFVALGLDELIAEDATPFSPQTLGWLRTVRRWAGAGPPLSADDVEAAREVARRLGPALRYAEDEQTPPTDSSDSKLQ